MRQYLVQLRDDLKRDCLSLQVQLEGKKVRLQAVEILLTDEKPTIASEDQNLLPGIVDEEDSRTDKAKEIIRNSRGKGVKPRDITRGLGQQGLKVGTGFASNLLWRLKNKTHETVEHNGRHYWKGFEPTIQRAPGGAL
jgi:hypothetical protein